MLQTAEIRWFIAGTAPPDVLDWFHQNAPQPEPPASRTDYYFRLFSGTDTLGIKLREGRLEVKQRVYQYGVVHLHPYVVGAMEEWHKWGFSLAEAENFLPAIKMSPSSWIEVNKTRQQQMYQITGDDTQIVPVAADSPAEQGCSFELTHITVAGKAWWTLGFEAFGPELRVQENLMLAATHIFAQNTPPRLRMRESYSYPGWLQFAGVHDNVSA